MSWLGIGKKTTFASNESVQLPRSLSNVPSISLFDFVQNTIPECQLNPLLFNGQYDVPVYYKRRVFQAEDLRYRGSFAVDFTVPEHSQHDVPLPPRTAYFTDEEFLSLSSTDDNKPLLVTLHGLSGGSHELYLRAVLKPLVDLGWKACVVNSRGCARSKITSGILFNARATWDVRQTVRTLRRMFPKRPLYGIGFSLGANILTNYLAEEGEDCLLNAAIVISNPWNLDVSSVALQRSWMGLQVYSKAMCINLKKLFERHVDQLAKHSAVDVEKVRKVTYLHEFDRELQCPTWGYPSEGAYYRDASSCDALLAIRIPLLAIHAEDDPIAVKEAIPYQEFRRNPYCALVTTSLGGHLGWFDFHGRWFADAAVAFLQRLRTDVDFTKLRIEASATNISFEASAGNPGVFLPVRRRLKFVGQTWEL